MMSNRPDNHENQRSEESGLFAESFGNKGNDDSPILAESLPTPEPIEILVPETKSRLGRQRLLSFLEILSNRDLAVLRSIDCAKYMTTSQICRLHFADAVSGLAASRNSARMMRRLREYGFVKAFGRRIGGIRAGSNAYIWALTEAGQRLLALSDDEEKPSRGHRHIEPSYSHLRHTVAVAECYVQVAEIVRNNPDISLKKIEWEPDCWRPYTRDGRSLRLKPDLFLVTRSQGFEDRWFMEMDLCTESVQVVVEKGRRYYDYFRTGIEQKKHEVFPMTVWIVPTAARKEKLTKGFELALKSAAKMFIVITPDELEKTIKEGGAANM